jgi:hypothetical protein
MDGFALGWEVRCRAVVSWEKGRDRMKGDDGLSIPGTGEERKKKEKKRTCSKRDESWLCFVLFGLVCVWRNGGAWMIMRERGEKGSFLRVCLIWGWVLRNYFCGRNLHCFNRVMWECCVFGGRWAVSLMLNGMLLLLRATLDRVGGIQITARSRGWES